MALVGDIQRSIKLIQLGPSLQTGSGKPTRVCVRRRSRRSEKRIFMTRVFQISSVLGSTKTKRRAAPEEAKGSGRKTIRLSGSA